MPSKFSTIHIQRTDLQDLDEYAKKEFGTTDIPYRVIVQHLLAEHVE